MVFNSYCCWSELRNAPVRKMPDIGRPSTTNGAGLPRSPGKLTAIGASDGHEIIRSGIRVRPSQRWPPDIMDTRLVNSRRLNEGRRSSDTALGDTKKPFLYRRQHRRKSAFELSDFDFRPGTSASSSQVSEAWSKLSFRLRW